MMPKYLYIFVVEIIILGAGTLIGLIDMFNPLYLWSGVLIVAVLTLIGMLWYDFGKTWMQNTAANATLQNWSHVVTVVLCVFVLAVLIPGLLAPFIVKYVPHMIPFMDLLFRILGALMISLGIMGALTGVLTGRTDNKLKRIFYSSAFIVAGVSLVTAFDTIPS